MNQTIKIKAITSMAMTEDAGFQLRKEMNEAMQNEQQIILDFEGIKLFATPFFNASIGYFVMRLSPEKYKEQVKVINLTELGMETYTHSFQNAVSVYESKADLDMIGKITVETIEEQ